VVTFTVDMAVRPRSSVAIAMKVYTIPRPGPVLYVHVYGGVVLVLYALYAMLFTSVVSGVFDTLM
jgi:hypothetical protein